MITWLSFWDIGEKYHQPILSNITRMIEDLKCFRVSHLYKEVGLTVDCLAGLGSTIDKEFTEQLYFCINNWSIISLQWKWVCRHNSAWHYKLTCRWSTDQIRMGQKEYHVVLLGCVACTQTWLQYKRHSSGYLSALQKKFPIMFGLTQTDLS